MKIYAVIKHGVVLKQCFVLNTICDEIYKKNRICSWII